MMTFSFPLLPAAFWDIRQGDGDIMMFRIIIPVERTKAMRVRMMAMILAAFLAAGAVRISAEAAEVKENAMLLREESADRASRAMFSVLGLAFLCAGGMVALIMVKDRT